MNYTNLKNKSDWVQRKLLFNQNLNEQAQKVIFSRKMAKLFYSQNYFNNLYTYRNLYNDQI